MSGLVLLPAGRWRLAVRRFSPDGPPRRAALLTHAMMATADYTVPLARHLATRGVDAFVLDWRGHGASGPPFARDADWSLDDYVREDYPTALAHVRAASPAAAAGVAVVAHSLGGLVALGHATSVDPDAAARLVLVATCHWRRRLTSGRLRRAGRDAVMAAWAALALGLGRVPARRLRLGAADEPGSYAVALARGYFTSRFSSRAGIDYLARLDRVRAPALAVIGARDPLAPPQDCEAILERLGGPVQRVSIPTRDHFGLYRRPAGRALWDDLASFVLADR